MSELNSAFNLGKIQVSYHFHLPRSGGVLFLEPAAASLLNCGIMEQVPQDLERADASSRGASDVLSLVEEVAENLLVSACQSLNRYPVRA